MPVYFLKIQTSLHQIFKGPQLVHPFLHQILIRPIPHEQLRCNNPFILTPSIKQLQVLKWRQLITDLCNWTCLLVWGSEVACEFNDDVFVDELVAFTEIFSV